MLIYIIINFSILNLENKGISSCAEILLLDYIEEKRGHSHRSSSHLLFILLREDRRSYSCAQRKQAWPLCQMDSELSEVIKQLGEYKAFLSESRSSFSCLKYNREFLSRLLLTYLPAKNSSCTTNHRYFHCNECFRLICAWDKNQEKEKGLFTCFLPIECV